MIFTLARRPEGAPLRSWNTTCIFLRVPSSIGFAKTNCFFRWISITAAGCFFIINFHVKSIYAQEVYLKHDVDVEFLGAIALKSHDIDGDGDMDIVGAGLSIDKVAWWENMAGDGASWSFHTISDVFHGARFVDAADLDGDGDLDLFGAAATDDLVAWWENTSGNGSEWVEHTIDMDFDFVTHLHAADLDDDGDMDIIGAALKGDAINWWENSEANGSVWTEHVVAEEFDGARHVCSVDMDGDGDLDLLGSATIADDIMWWENTVGDATTWEGHLVDENFDGVNVVVPVDIDKDGDVDLLGSADVADEIAIWFNLEGDALSWSRIPVDENFDGAFSTVPADMDGDGDIDVLGAAYEGNIMMWWENTSGEGNSWKEHPIDEEFAFPMTINVSDLDGDGDLDILGGSYYGEVAWWEGDGGTLPVELTSFDAIVSDREVVLQWETASESNNAGFEVQHRPGRPEDASTQPWRAADFVLGAGTENTPRQYRYSFSELLPGNHRFRLKQIDFDGGFAYSPVVEVVLTAGGKQTMSALYPNPFNPKAQFYLTLSNPQEVRIDVYNALGQKVTELFNGPLEGDQVHTFDFEAGDLPGGLYLINATGRNFSTTQQAMLVK